MSDEVPLRELGVPVAWIYRSDLDFAVAHARKRACTIELHNHVFDGDPTHVRGMSPTMMGGGLRVGQIEPDGRIMLETRLRIVEDVILQPGSHHSNS